MYIDSNRVIDQLQREIPGKFVQQYERIYHNQMFEIVEIDLDQNVPNTYLVFLHVKYLLNLYNQQ